MEKECNVCHEVVTDYEICRVCKHVFCRVCWLGHFHKEDEKDIERTLNFYSKKFNMTREEVLKKAVKELVEKYGYQIVH